MAAVAAAAVAGGHGGFGRRRSLVGNQLVPRSTTDGSCSVNSKDSHMSYRSYAKNSGPLRRGADAEASIGVRSFSPTANTSLMRWMDVELKSRLQVIDGKLERLLQGEIVIEHEPRIGNLGMGNRRGVLPSLPVYPSVSPRTRAVLASASSPNCKSSAGRLSPLDLRKCTAGDQLPACTPTDRSEGSEQESNERRDSKQSKTERKVAMPQDQDMSIVASDLGGPCSFSQLSLDMAEVDNVKRQVSDGNKEASNSIICASFQNMLNMRPDEFKEVSNRLSGDRPERQGSPSPGVQKIKSSLKSAKDRDSGEGFGYAAPSRSTESTPSVESDMNIARSIKSLKSVMSGASEKINRTSQVARQVLFAFDDPETSRMAQTYARLMCSFLLVTVPFTLSQTYENPPIYGIVPAVVEMSIDCILFLEFFIRFMLSPDKKIFIRDEINIIDLFAALPAIVVRIYAGFVLPEDATDSLEGVFLLGLVPVLRLLKTIRHLRKFHLLVMSCKLALEALPTLLFALLVLTLAFAPIIFLVESRENIPTLPKAIWLTIVTMTTVGYGDTTPKTNAGSIVVGILVISSVLFMAMPLGIIGQAFNEIWQDRDRILLARSTRERLVQWGYTAQDIPRLFEGYGDGTGELNIDEFRDMIQKLSIGLSDERTIELFQSFDEDGSGSIDAQEFTRLLFPKEYFKIYGNT